MNLSRRSMLAGSAAVAIAPAVLGAIPANAEVYGVSQAAAVLPDIKAIQAWQRRMAEYIERVVRPPIILHSNWKVEKLLNPHQDETFKALMACKPVGA